jgi:hypothetical protein
VTRARLVAEILSTYARAWVLLRRRPLPDALAALRTARRPRRAEDPRRLGRAVIRTLRLLPTDSRCLVRSATLTGLLADRGLPGTVVLGVRPGEEFAAHAWVELDGVPLLPDGQGRYERLAEL